MTLSELETKLNISYPKRFHEIHDTGAMEWYECTSQEAKAKRQLFLNDPKTFMVWEADCEMLSFADVEDRIQDLNEWMSWRVEDEGLQRNQAFRLIPFGMTCTGDLYCFAFRENNLEPCIVLYLHDEYSDPEIYGEDFDAFLYRMMLEAVSCWDADIHSEAWKSHLTYLSPEYQKKLSGKSMEELNQMYHDLSNDALPLFI